MSSPRHPTDRLRECTLVNRDVRHDENELIESALRSLVLSDRAPSAQPSREERALIEQRLADNPRLATTHRGKKSKRGRWSGGGEPQPPSHLPAPDKYDPGRQRFLVTQDISAGLERQPIPVYSDVGEADPPPPFHYTLESVCELRTIVPPENKDARWVSCGCAPRQCGVNSKCACRNSKYNANPIDLSSGVPSLSPRSAALNVQCGEWCDCMGLCDNSILARRPGKKRLEVFMRDETVGFGLRTTEYVAFGEVVCEFAGEVVSLGRLEELNREDEGHGLYSLRLADVNSPLFPPETGKLVDRKKLSVEYHIDPYRIGNAARFMSHSCWPNCMPVTSVRNLVHPTSAHIYMVAVQAMPPGTELTFDYGDDYVRSNLEVCMCASQLCVHGPHASVDWNHVEAEKKVALLAGQSRAVRSRLCEEYRRVKKVVDREKKEEEEKRAKAEEREKEERRRSRAASVLADAQTAAKNGRRRSARLSKSVDREEDKENEQICGRKNER